MSDAGAITFRRLTMADLPMFIEWRARPHVMEWWPNEPPSEIEAEYTELTAPESTTIPYVVLREGEPVGYIQSYVAAGSGEGWWPDVTDPGVRGIDQFLAHAGHLNQGMGTTMVRAFVRTLFADPAVTRVQVDPAPGNTRAIRCYEKAGFRRDGLIETPDGQALIMYWDRGE
jgi:RimJ/RimL family protein N-acetyltransferase